MSFNPILITEPFDSSLSLKESQIMSNKFFHSYLNNDFFLNDKNKPILEKIHEDLQYVFSIFHTLINFRVEFDFFWMGKSLTDFISGKAEFINHLELGMSFNENFTHFQHNKFSHLDQLTQYLFETYQIPCEKTLENDLIENTFYPYLCESIELKGKHFSIKLFTSLRSDNTMVNHYPLDILRVKLKVFSNKSENTMISLLDNIHLYISHLEFKENFIASLLSQKVHYKNNALSSTHITHDFNAYLIPILSTYPTFSILIEKPESSNADYIQQSLNKISSYHKLQQHLEHKNTSIKKIKI